MLLISSCKLPNLPVFDIDTARGKRAADVDLDFDTGKDTVRSLIKEADVLLQAYRREWQLVFIRFDLAQWNVPILHF